jgi:hypothetical protein
VLITVCLVSVECEMDTSVSGGRTQKQLLLLGGVFIFFCFRNVQGKTQIRCVLYTYADTSHARIRCLSKLCPSFTSKNQRPSRDTWRLFFSAKILEYKIVRLAPRSQG